MDLTRWLDLSRICPVFKTGLPGAEPPADFDLPEVGSEGRRSGNSPHKDRRRTVFRAPGARSRLFLGPVRPGVRLHRRSLALAILVPWNCRAGSCQEPALQALPGTAWQAMARNGSDHEVQIAEHGSTGTMQLHKRIPDNASPCRIRQMHLQFPPGAVAIGTEARKTCGCVQRPGVPWQCAWW